VSRAGIDRFLVSSPAGPAAVFLFDHLFAPHGRRERVLGALAGRSGWLARAALAGGRAAEEGRAGAAAALERLLAVPPAAGGGPEAGLAAGAGVAEWLLAGPREEDRRRRFTAWLFPPGAGGRAACRPDRVVKLRREGGAGAALAAEAEALVDLARELPQPLGRTVPTVLGHGRLDAAGAAWEVLVLSALPGRSAYVELQAAPRPARLAARHLPAAGAWLARFHRATVRRGSLWRPPAWAELAPGGEAPPPEWYRRLRAELAEAPWPLAAGHGDFWARNVLVCEPGDAPPPGPGLSAEGGLPGVVDWEHFRSEAPPFEDLFHFAWSYGASFPWRGRRRPPEEAFRRTFLDDTAVAREVRRYLAAYARETGLDAGALGDLFRVFLLTQPRSEDRVPWLTFYRLLEGAGRSVFSG
jgi:hypothetical protein